MIEKDLLLALLKESVDVCYKKDWVLIERGMERASVARIYYYMNRALEQDERFGVLSKYNLDTEYNKNGEQIKRTARFKRGTQPDIILHHRLDEPYQDNLLIIEFKCRKRNSSRDKEKLEDFTSKESGYNYFLGVLVILNKENVEYEYFQDGCIKQEIELLRFSCNNLTNMLY